MTTLTRTLRTLFALATLMAVLVPIPAASQPANEIIEVPAAGTVTITASAEGAVNVSCVSGVLVVANASITPASPPCSGVSDLTITTGPATASVSFDNVELAAAVDVVADGGGSDAIILEGNLSANSLGVAATAVVIDGTVQAQSIAIVAAKSVVALPGSNVVAPGGSVIIDAGTVGLVQHDHSTIDVRGGAGEVVVTGANVGISGDVLADGDRSSISLLSGQDGLTLIGGTVAANAADAHGTGGSIRILGGNVALIGASSLSAGASISANGPHGGGSILVGGDQGGRSPIPTAFETIVGADVVIEASATRNGDGGTVIVWADGDTIFEGRAVAAGTGTGEGGFVELSGKTTLDNRGETDVAGPGGPGEVLLDPLYFTVLPAGLLSQLTAIDEADAVATKATPLPALDTAELLGNAFCELLEIGGCGPIQAPSLQDYTTLYGSQNTLVSLLSKIPQLKPIEPRAWFTFMSTPTLEGFQGNIKAQGIFGVQILPGAPTSLGWVSSSLSDTSLDLSHQGPGEKVEFETFFSVITMGTITASGAELTFKAGEPFTIDSLEDIIRGYVPAGSLLLQPDFLHNLDFKKIVDDGIAGSLTGVGNEQSLLDLIELVDLLSGGQVPEVAYHVPGVMAQPQGPGNIASTVDLLNALGAPVPSWMTDIGAKMAEIDGYLSRFPGPIDVFDAALGGITVPTFPGTPGIVTPSFCAGTESGGKCYVLGLAPHNGTPGVETPGGCVGTWSGGRCWSTPPVPAVEACEPFTGSCATITPAIPGIPGTIAPSTCVTVYVGGTCYSIPPFAGQELGYTPAVCVIVWVGNDCYTLPPLPSINIPGMCDANSAIPCSTTELISKGLLPIVEEALLSYLPGDLNGIMGSAPSSLVIPDVTVTNVIPALLYVDSEITNPAGPVNFRNSSVLGTVLLGDVVTGETINVDVERGAVVNRRLDPALVLGVLGLANVPTGTRGDAALVANTLIIDADQGIGEFSAPIAIRQLSPAGLNATIYTDNGGLHLFTDRDLTLTGTLTSNSGATLRVGAGATVDLTGATIDIDETYILEYYIDGGILDLRAPTTAASISVAGAATQDIVRIAPYADKAITVDGGDGIDTITFYDNGGTYLQTTAKTIEVDGMAPISFTNVERIENLRPRTTGIDGPSAVTEGATYSVDVSFIDWGADSWSLDVDWGDGVTQSIPYSRAAADADVAELTATLQHVYADNGTYDIDISVVDALDSQSDSVSTSVNVDNVDPVIAAGADQPLAVEGDTIVLDPSTFFDAGSADTHWATIAWGDGSALAVGTVTETPIGPATDGSGMTGSIDASHNYADDGTYTVSVCVTDDDGGSHCDAIGVTVRNATPVVEAGLDQLSIFEGDWAVLDPASFTDAGTADTHTATVSWGDTTAPQVGTVTETPYGPPGSATPLTGTVDDGHAYADDGVYPVEVCVTDDDAAVACDQLQITVQNLAPVADAGQDIVVDEGSTASLAFAGFIDAGTLDTHTATVDWGDGTALESADVTEFPQGPPGSIQPSTGIVSASHVYADNGIYTAEVCVTDDDAGVSCDTAAVEVLNVAPVIEPGSLQTVAEGEAVTPGILTISDRGTLDTHTVTVDWGDASAIDAGTVTEVPFGPPGTLDPLVGSVEFPAHAYADNGRYEVTTCVTDDDAETGCTSQLIMVTNVTPVVTAAVEAAEIEGGVVTLDPSSFIDAGTLDAHTATIDWGDGSELDVGLVEETPTGPAGSTTPATGTVSGEHVYANDDTYTVEVCVTDHDGAMHCDSQDVTIANVAPVVTVDEPRTADEGAEFALASTSFTDAGTGDAHTAVVDWGDGTEPIEATVTEEPFGPPGSTTPLEGTVDAAHIYADDGIYTVEVCVSDDDVTTCDSFQVTIENVAPTVAPAIDETVAEGVEITLGETTLNDAGTADTHTATVNWGDTDVVEEVVVTEEPTGPGGSAEGTTGELAAAHIYATNGDYTVEVCVRDDDQPEDEASVCERHEVTVTDQLASTDAGFGRTVAEGELLQLARADFTDPGTADQHSASVFWGDGVSETALVQQPAPVIPGSETPAAGTIDISPHRYGDDGSYLVSVCADDREIGSTPAGQVAAAANCDDILVIATNVAPTVTVTRGQAVVDEGETATLGAISFTDPGWLDTHTIEATNSSGETLEVSPIVYGDVPQSQGTIGQASIPDHAFESDGLFTTTLCALDDDGGRACGDFTTVVQNVAPTIELDAAAMGGDEGSAVALPTVVAHDPGTADTLTATVDWGDGDVTTHVLGDDQTLADASHVYVDNGVYLVQVCVDDGADSACAQATATIDNVAPTFELTLQGTSSSGDPSGFDSIVIGEAGELDTHTATVDWGDETGVEVLGAEAFRTVDGQLVLDLPDHVWDEPGVYDITVCVTDSDGAEVCQTVSREVEDSSLLKTWMFVAFGGLIMGLAAGAGALKVFGGLSAVGAKQPA